MKTIKYQLIFFLSFFNFIVLFSQEKSYGIVEYESIISSEKRNEYMRAKRKKIKNKKLTKTLDRVFSYTKPIKSKLIFSEEKGVFKVEDKLNVDIHDLGQRINQISAGGSNIYYYNAKTKTYLIKECESVGECFIFPNTYLEWQLTQESKKINGYKSYKATRSNGKVIAWYTPLIPVNFGPKGEYGLPGLILELEIGKIIFKAKKIILNPKEKIYITNLKGGKKVTKEEYKKIINKAKTSVFGKDVKN